MNAETRTDPGLSSHVTATPFGPCHALPARHLDCPAVTVGCLVFALVLFLPPILNDGDTLWQISTGAWIIDHRVIPAFDPFSFTAGNRPWFAHEWLAETLMALAFRVGGMRGVMALAAATSGLTAAMLLHHARRFLPGLYALTAVVVALSVAAGSMLARPHLIAWPCLALWCGSLAIARSNRTAPSFALLPVMVLWVNLHGSFMVGLLLSGAFMVEAALDFGGHRRWIFASWAGFVLAAWSATLINPDFLAGVLFPIHLVGMKSLAMIGEWKPPDFSRFQLLEVVILGGLALGLTGKVTLPPIRLLILLGLVHGALSHARNGQLLGIVGMLVLAEPLSASLAGDSLVGISLAPGRGEALGLRWRWLSAGAPLLAAAALATRIALPLSPERTGAAFAAMLDVVPLSLRTQPVLNEYALGGQLIFNGVRPFIDGRADLYGDAFLDRYQRIVLPDPAELSRALSEYHIAWTIFPAGHPIVPVMDEMPGWRRLIDTGDVVVHARERTIPSPRPSNAALRSGSARQGSVD